MSDTVDGLVGALRQPIQSAKALVIAVIVAPIGMAISFEVDWGLDVMRVRAGQTALSHQAAEGIDDGE